MKATGFTLLEVMVALSILALSLTAIFTSQVGALKIAQRSENTSVGTLLARCKMGEVEQQVANEGLPADDRKGRDKCCEDGEVKGFRCEWRIERVILPEPSEFGANDPLQQVTDDQDQEGSETSSPVNQVLSGAGSPDAMANIALSYSLPVMKPVIESQVRRATVKVIWNEGPKKERSFEVVQYLVSDQPVAPTPVEEPVPGTTAP